MDKADDYDPGIGAVQLNQLGRVILRSAYSAQLKGCRAVLFFSLFLAALASKSTNAETIPAEQQFYPAVLYYWWSPSWAQFPEYGAAGPTRESGCVNFYGYPNCPDMVQRGIYGYLCPSGGVSTLMADITVCITGLACPENQGWTRVGTSCIRPDCSSDETRNTWQVGSLGQCISATLNPKNAGAPPRNSCIGNPINSGTGNKFQTETDYLDSHPFRLRLIRFYNAQSGDSGVLGSGWNAFPKITLIDGNHLNLVRTDGKTFAYILVNAVWIPEADITDTLISTPAGFRLITAEGNQEVYDTTGKLLSL